MMIIKETNNNNNYCIVHEVIHANTRQYEICDYCLHHKRWMYPRVMYYRHGFAKKDVLMCDDCQKIEEKHFEYRLIAVTTEHNAYEAICEIIKEKTSTSTSTNCFSLQSNQQTREQGNGNVSAAATTAINYYDAVRLAYQNSRDVRQYLVCAIENINKDLQIIWEFTYRILNYERRVKVVNKDTDNLLVSWTNMK